MYLGAFPRALGKRVDLIRSKDRQKRVQSRIVLKSMAELLISDLRDRPDFSEIAQLAQIQQPLKKSGSDTQ